MTAIGCAGCVRQGSSPPLPTDRCGQSGTDPPHDDESASHEPEKQQDFKSRQSNKFSSNMSGNEPIEPFSETSASSHLFDEPTAEDLARPSADSAKQAVNTEESAGCTAFNQGTTETTPVVGCKKNEHASRSTALSDERHVVDPADHKTIWDADYYKALFEDPAPS